MPYLRLVDSPGRSDAELPSNESDGVLLGFVDMSRTSDIALETILLRVQPAWAFDLRPVPYFNIGRLNRKRVFELFRTCSTSYRDVAGALRITEHNDASLNSGAVGRFLNQAIGMRPLDAPIVVLVDDKETLAHAMSVLPGCLRSLFETSLCPMTLNVEVRDGGSDLLLCTAGGIARALEAKWLGERERASASVAEAFRIVLQLIKQRAAEPNDEKIKMRGYSQVGHDAVVVWSPTHQTHVSDLQAQLERGCTERPRGSFQQAGGLFFSWLNAPKERCELCGGGPCRMRGHL